MKRHSRGFKILSVILSVILFVSSSLVICQAATQTVTTSYECGKLFCSNDLICVGPIGRWDTIPSSVPYIGGTTLMNSTILEEEYNDTIAALQEDWDADVTYEEHIYIVYCPDYDSSNLIDHTMIVFFVAHRIGYSNPKYSKYSATAHQIYYPCVGSTTDDFSKTINLGKSLSSSKEDAIYEAYVKNQTVGCSSTFYGYTQSHTFTYTDWTSADGTNHQRTKTCSLCGYSATETESHSLDYGDWTSNGSSQHKRTVSCATCGYSTTETASHSLSYGSWTSTGSSQHQRSVSCSTCDYNTTESASHSLSYGNWEATSSFQHQRTVSCSTCGYSSTQTADHSWTISDYSSTGSSQHTYKRTCSVCGYSETVTENHSITYGSWSVYDENQHRRLKSCTKCGYSAYEYENHSDDDDDSLCDDCMYAMTVFSVTVPTTMNIAMDKKGNVYSADDVKIYNNSTDSVEVKSISLTADNGWTIVPYSTNMANEKVNSKMIGLKICNATSTSGNSMNMTGDWNISKGSSLDLTYDAVVSATTEAVTDTKLLEITYIIDWSDS